MKLTFWMQMSKFPTNWCQHLRHQSFLQGDRHDHENMKGMLMSMTKHSQSNEFAISLQYLKKEVRNGVKDQNFYKLAYHFLIKVTTHVQSTQKRIFIKFLQYIKSKLTWDPKWTQTSLIFYFGVIFHFGER